MNKTREIIVTQTFNELGIQINLKTAPLVRCKDCKYYSHDVDANEGEWDRCRVYGHFVDPDDYCSDGEPKEQEHECE